MKFKTNKTKTMKHFLLYVFLFSANTLLSFAQLKTGDIITVDGAQYTLKSENLIANPGFEEGLTGWTDATSSANTLSTSNFTIVETGGVDDSKYLVGTKNDSSNGAGSIGTGWAVEAGKTYYFSYHVRYLSTTASAGTEEWLKVSLTHNKTASAEPLILMGSANVEARGQWTQNSVVFTNSDDYAFVVARFRWLDNRLGFDEFALHEVIEVANVYGLEQLIGEAQELLDPAAEKAAELQSAIEEAQEYLTSESAEEVNQAIADLRQAIASYQYANASGENPLDMTHFIVNPGFDENTPTGWKGIGVIDYNEVEFYEKTFNMYQEISGLPAGKYVLKAQGFERPKSNDGGAAYRAGTETIYARFYAKAGSFPEKTAPFSSIYAHTYSGTGALNGYVNTMSAAKTMLTNTANAYYEVTVSDFLLDEGDVLTIGARSDFKQTGYWTLFDNFRLEYLGAFDSNDLGESLRDLIAQAQELLEEKMQNSVREELTSALTRAEQLVEGGTKDYDTLYPASQALNTAIQAAQASIALYAELQEMIEEALEIHPFWSGTKAMNLLKAITTAQEAVGQLDLDSDQLNSALTALKNLILKKIYIPTWMMGNVNDPNNNWSMERSRESKNWIIFWEPGYGPDPSAVADGNYRIDIDGILDLADHCFDFYTDSLKFTKRGSSKTDTYKMIIRLRYTRDWEASGSGVDDQIGLLTLTAWSAQVAGHTLAHEVGHCFQYQVHCDNGNQNGWMYGFGSNASGGNGFWEQCAQWQGYKIYPAQQFTDSNFGSYLNTVHKHILHEAPRYDNYFIMDYWSYLHGVDIIGRMWNLSKSPEDPVEAYKRITNITQSQFNDEIYDCAARFATWDIPAIKSYGESKISARPQPAMVSAGDDHWLISPSVCLENYGHNIIKLNAPRTETKVSVAFEGKAGLTGYRRLNVTSAGWRFGFVALLGDGTRVYSDMGSAAYRTPTDTLHFDCPADTKQLWLVVTGAPATHWRHAWDDDDTNDEQWPYQVKFKNTNLYGRTNPTAIQEVKDTSEENLRIYASENTLFVEELSGNAVVGIYDLTGRNLRNEQVQGSSFSAVLPSGIYLVTVQDASGKYTRKVVIR